MGKDGSQKAVFLIKDAKNVKTYELLAEDHSRSLQNTFITINEFGASKDSYVQVSEDEIRVFNRKRELVVSIRGAQLKSCVNVHERFLYAFCGKVFDGAEIVNHVTGQTYFQQPGEKEQDSQGFFVFNVLALVQGRIEKYKIGQTIGGLLSMIDYNAFSERITYIRNFNMLIVMPLPHLNIINFVGMENKHHYLIWREKKAYFTALSETGLLQTWSTLTGKLLYTLPQEGDASFQKLSSYEVYRGDVNDLTYTRNFYNFNNYSLNLLCSRLPVDDVLLDQLGQESQVNT